MKWLTGHFREIKERKKRSHLSKITFYYPMICMYNSNIKITDHYGTEYESQADGSIKRISEKMYIKKNREVLNG